MILAITNDQKAFNQMLLSKGVIPYLSGDFKNLNEFMDEAEKREFRVNPEVEKTRIEFAEKRLEIRKELLKDTPDWAKIQKI